MQTNKSKKAQKREQQKESIRLLEAISAEPTIEKKTLETTSDTLNDISSDVNDGTEMSTLAMDNLENSKLEDLYGNKLPKNPETEEDDSWFSMGIRPILKTMMIQIIML